MCAIKGCCMGRPASNDVRMVSGFTGARWKISVSYTHLDVYKRQGTDKALLPWPPATPGTPNSAGQTFLSAAILALRPFTQAVVVVAGKNADKLAAVVYASGALLVQLSLIHI